jgi:hypothetical protein
MDERDESPAAGVTGIGTPGAKAVAAAAAATEIRYMPMSLTELLHMTQQGGAHAQEQREQLAVTEGIAKAEGSP